jgi:polyisoprenyl-phosphate glycosyltransferase
VTTPRHSVSCCQQIAARCGTGGPAVIGAATGGDSTQLVIVDHEPRPPQTWTSQTFPAAVFDVTAFACSAVLLVRPAKSNVLLSVVIPCFNESLSIVETKHRLCASLEKIGDEFELVFVDDGSTDETPAVLRRMAADDKRCRVIALSRNFGHQLAVSAGIKHADGQAIVLIDADLQDPPEVINEMVELWRAGYDVVYGVRIERRGESRFKRACAAMFYRLINLLSDTAIPLDTGDFRLMDRKVVSALGGMPERDRFLRGMISWVGFRQVALPYRRDARFAGETKYPLWKMIRFALDGMTSFSTAPLRLASWLGFLVSSLALVGILIALFFRLFTRAWVPGWAGLFIAVLFIGGVQLVCLGVVGEYVGRIYGEVKRRPLFLVDEAASVRLSGSKRPTPRYSMQSDRGDAAPGYTVDRRPAAPTVGGARRS